MANNDITVLGMVSLDDELYCCGRPAIDDNLDDPVSTLLYKLTTSKTQKSSWQLAPNGDGCPYKGSFETILCSRSKHRLHRVSCRCLSPNRCRVQRCYGRLGSRNKMAGFASASGWEQCGGEQRESSLVWWSKPGHRSTALPMKTSSPLTPRTANRCRHNGRSAVCHDLHMSAPEQLNFTAFWSLPGVTTAKCTPTSVML